MGGPNAYKKGVKMMELGSSLCARWEDERQPAEAEMRQVQTRGQT